MMPTCIYKYICVELGYFFMAWVRLHRSEACTPNILALPATNCTCHSPSLWGQAECQALTFTAQGQKRLAACVERLPGCVFILVLAQLLIQSNCCG
eukprot:scaffold136014_cov16-Tisochrysis_lutea.AAC.2